MWARAGLLRRGRRLWRSTTGTTLTAATRDPDGSRFFSLILPRASFASAYPPPPPPAPSATVAAAAAAAGEGLLFNDPTRPPPSAATAAPTLLQPRVVIYDGVCHLCHTGVKWVIKADKYKKIKFCCLQSKAAEPYLRLCGLDQEDVLRRFLFVEGPYSYYQASTAALKVASYLPFPYTVVSALLIIPTPLRDLVYDYVAKRRYEWFGKEEECIVVREEEMLDRFIDRDEMLKRVKDEFS